MVTIFFDGYHMIMVMKGFALDHGLKAIDLG
jgi:hypothetical protein